MKLLLLDLWGTVFYPKVSMEEFWRVRASHLRDALEEAGYSFTLQEVYRACRAGRAVTDRLRRTTGREVDVKGELVLVLHHLGVPTDPSEAMVEAYLHPYVHLPEKAPGVEALVEEAHSLGYTVAAASNVMSWRHAAQALRRLGLQALFDYYFYSDIIGWRKPTLHFYMHIFSTLGATPSSTVMIGDEEGDVAVERLGAKAIAYEGFHPYTGELEPTARVKSHVEAARLLRGITYGAKTA